MDNRINQLSIGSSLDRAAVKDDFGQMLARGIATGANALGGVAANILPGGGVISAALTRTAHQALTPQRAVGNGAPQAGLGTEGAGASSVLGNTSGGEGLDSVAALQRQNQQWTAQYLALQEGMQRESREYNAVSNILKVRHESAKTAINNIR